MCGCNTGRQLRQSASNIGAMVGDTGSAAQTPNEGGDSDVAPEDGFSAGQTLPCETTDQLRARAANLAAAQSEHTVCLKLELEELKSAADPSHPPSPHLHFGASSAHAPHEHEEHGAGSLGPINCTGTGNGPVGIINMI